MPRRSSLPVAGPEPITTSSIGSFGLFLPFIVVFVAVLLTGHTPAQIAGASLLLLVPVVILVLRRRARSVA